MKLKCVTKWYKRVAFMHAEQISDRQIYNTMQKYSKKYTSKLQKLNLPADPDGLRTFQHELKAKLDKERSLSHSKAREYWILRGPRLFAVSIIAVGSNIAYNEMFIQNPSFVRGIVHGTTLLFLSFYMLFMRLPDSIHGSMMRIGHAHYKQWKQNRGFAQ